MDEGTLPRRLPCANDDDHDDHDRPDRALTFTPITLDCPECPHRLYADYNNFRTVTTLDGVIRLTLTIRAARSRVPRFLRPNRPRPSPTSPCPITSSDSTS